MMARARRGTPAQKRSLRVALNRAVVCRLDVRPAQHAGVLEDAEVLRDRLRGDLEVFCDRAGRQFVVADEAQDPDPLRFGQCPGG